ncbi:FCD domain-containing protein [Streptomyces sp. NPDC056949]|uniref:FCD domain-containing protein n=1 Tax=Streptomyces sp. NPDC056949 TaxID=3345976 RepID=UPI0036383C7E
MASCTGRGMQGQNTHPLGARIVGGNVLEDATIDVPRPRHGQPLMSGLADVRSLVEPSAAQRTAFHRSDNDLQAMQTALEAMADDARSPQPPPEADAAFHPALLNTTRNETHARMDMLLEAGLRECDPALHAHDHGTDPVPSHQVVLDPVRDQGPPR